ncbi:esterase FE4-like [Zerene cesonia]|uniref:esterase FE4-like n=1 Tax=Zerene cesonia TaxID=33412 RepID=UPI0018E4FD59|nr:esterase FE4-like [Zerene cesonia]
MGKKWVVLWSLWACQFVQQPTIPVLVTNGLLRGSVAPDGSHLRYSGIPYAVAPKRFAAPRSEPTWRGVFEATDEHIRCPQRIGESLLVGQEDCLTLNVYTPITQPATQLPVMVFIHGGGFYDGSGTASIFGPKHLVSHEIVLVTINYRLNIQGFACLGIKDAPGNAGMKDQVAALRWVQRNIKAFGGDPDNVTIFGESAGSGSVSLHILSPMSKGLFHKAILQSGSSTAPWSMQFRPLYMTSLLTKVMGYNTEDAHDLYNILMQKSDADLVITRVPRKEGNIIISECLYVPCVENIIDGEEPFLTELPHDILSKGNYNKVPVMIGSNSHEGYLFAAMENDTTIPKFDFEKSLPKDLVIPDKEKRVEVARKLHEFYLRGEKPSRENILEWARFHGEIYFTYPVLEETMLYLETNIEPVYSYLFKYSGNRNLIKILSGKPFSTAPGATHADELMYIFSQHFLGTLFESKMVERMTTMWTNFAKYGDPTPKQTKLLPLKWPPITKKSLHTFGIDSEFSIEPLWNHESLKYIRHIYSKYRRRQTRD